MFSTLELGPIFYSALFFPYLDSTSPSCMTASMWMKLMKKKILWIAITWMTTFQWLKIATISLITNLHLENGFAIGFRKRAFPPPKGGTVGENPLKMRPNLSFQPILMKFAPEVGFCILKMVLRPDLRSLGNSSPRYWRKNKYKFCASSCLTITAYFWICAQLN